MQNKQFSIEIKSGSIETAVALSNQIPEFDNPHPVAEYYKRMEGKNQLVLIAYVDDKPVGFKVGYDKGDHFYSWMGAILPNYRKMGIAKKLAKAQEQWAIEAGYETIIFKTRNVLKPMLHFALGNGFNILEVIPRETIEEYRIVLQKRLV